MVVARIEWKARTCSIVSHACGCALDVDGTCLDVLGCTWALLWVCASGLGGIGLLLGCAACVERVSSGVDQVVVCVCVRVGPAGNANT